MATLHQEVTLGALSKPVLDALEDRFDQYEQNFHDGWANAKTSEAREALHVQLSAMLALKKDLLRDVETGKRAGIQLQEEMEQQSNKNKH